MTTSATLEYVDILLVEDSPTDLELTESALTATNLDCTLQIARDGEEALDFLFCRGPFSERDISQGPRVVLLDLKLPKVDGLEVLRELRRDPRTKILPVVVLTSSAEDRDLIESYQLGVNSYIVKPVDFERFKEVIKELGIYWLLLNKQPPGPPDDA
jgi:two-component system, response regulator